MFNPKNIARPTSQDNFESKTFDGSVTSVNPGEESVNFDGPTGPDTTRVPHPMLSPDAWIRALPQQGSRLLLTPLAGSIRRASSGYYSRAVSEYIAAYKAGRGIYKPLSPGEWDLMTQKLAHIYGSSNGPLLLRGGPIQQELNPQKLTLRSRAPTHVRELHQKLDSEIVDQENFGVVVRHKNSNEKNRWITTPLVGSTEDTDAKGSTKTKSFAKEYMRTFGRDGTNLVDFREGDVYDDTGNRVKHSITGKNLRSSRKLYSATGESAVHQEVDEEGSLSLTSTGEKIDVVATNAATDINLDKLQATCAKSIDATARGAVTVKAGTTATFGGSSATLLGPDPNPADSILRGHYFLGQVMQPLLDQLITHFEAASKPPPLGPVDFNTYKPLMQVIAQTLNVIKQVMSGALSSNCKVSK